MYRASFVRDWLYNGRTHYKIGGVDELQSAIRLIESGLALGQKVFNFLDVGCANFLWGMNLMTMLNGHFSSQDIDVHIVGLTGSKDAYIPPELLKKIGVCSHCMSLKSVLLKIFQD